VFFIHQVLEADRQAPTKQRHTAQRIWERLQTELPQHPVSERSVRRQVQTWKREQYTCNYGQSGCTTAYRGNPTTITQPGKNTGMWHDIAGNVVTSTTNGVTSTSTPSSGSNYSVPSAMQYAYL